MRLEAEQKLLEVPMLNAKGTGVILHVKTGNRVFILNRSENEVCLPRGSVVALGFGRGKFKRVGAKDPADNVKDVPYRLEGPDSEVLGQNWKCTPLFFLNVKSFFGQSALSAHSLFTIFFKADGGCSDTKVILQGQLLPLSAVVEETPEGKPCHQIGLLWVYREPGSW